MPSNKKLREHARKRLDMLPEIARDLSTLEVGELMHELRVHQIELEVQNQELRTMQHRLEQVADQYTDLFDFAPVGYLITDKKGVILNINLTGCSMLGHERARIKGRPFSTYLAKGMEGSSFFFNHLKQVFETNAIQSCELELKRGGNNTFYAQLDSTAEVDIEDSTTQCRIVLRDLTDEKKTVELQYLNKALKQEKEKAQHYLEMSGVIFMTLNKEAVISMINDTGCKILGYDCNKANCKNSMNTSESGCQLEGLNWIDHFILRKDQNEIREIFDGLMSGGQNIENYEGNVRCKDGGQRTISWRSITLKDDKDQITGLLCSGTDISGLRQAEIASVTALLDGQESERQRIAADLHDSIQPLLATVKRNIESFNPHIETLSEDKKKDFESITKFLTMTIQEIKAISRNLASPSLKDFGLVVTLGDLCESMAQSEKLKVNFYNTGMDRKMAPSLSTELFRIAQELLTNAVKHANATTITLQLIGHEHSIILMIEDDGKGFDSQKKRTGMGINNILMRVKAIKGKVDIDSRVGKATTITVEVPRV